jgi:hypothetical protein
VRRLASRAVLVAATMLAPGATVPPAAEDLDPGWRLLREGRPAEAARVFAERVAADPSSSDGVRALVTALGRAGRSTEAVAAAQAFLDRSPASPEAWAHLGRAFLAAGRFDEAEQAFLESAALGPSPLGEWGLGKIAASRGEVALAAARFATARELAPHDDEILEAWLRAQDDPETEAKGWPLWLALDRRASASTRSFLEAALPVFGRYAEHRGVRLEARPGTSFPARLPLERLGRPPGARLDERRFVVAMETGKGRARRLLLDTGARGLTLSPAAARAAGFDELFSFRLQGFGDRAEGARAQVGVVRDLAIGPFVYRGGLAIRSSASNFPDGVDGILGIDLFSPWVLELDAGREELRVLPRGEPGEGFRAATTRRIDAHILVEAIVAGRVRGWFLLDSGASHTVVDLDLAEDLGGRTRSADWWVRGVAGTLKDLRTVPEATVEVAGLERRDPGLLAYSLEGVARDLGVRIAGVLGLSFLDGLVLRVDPAGAAVAFREAAVEERGRLR